LIEAILHWLKDIGLIGLIAAMFLEGSSIPFPGVVIVLAYGYILSGNYWNTAYIATLMSITYCLSSLIPYFLGRKLEGLFKKPGIQKAKDLFVRYGKWSVALSRPFGLGNYISYVAGMSKMNLAQYLALTFIGIYPWSYAMLLLGNYSNGSYLAFQAFYKDNSVYVYIAATILIGIIFLSMFLKHRLSRALKVDRGRGKG